MTEGADGALHVSIRRCRPEAGDWPRYMTEGASGMDVCAALPGPLEIPAGEAVLVPTGFILEIPVGWEAQVRPRSGLALRHRIGLLNSPGTIDADYRGELQVILFNFGREPFRVNPGDRIAQLVFARVCRVAWETGETPLSDTARSAGGFGHTGVQ